VKSQFKRLHTLSLFVLFYSVVVNSVVMSGQVAAESLVAPGATVKKLQGDFKFTEGPTPDKHGNLYFSDIPNNKIHKWSTEGELSLVRDNTGGANGLIFDRNGVLYACEGRAQRVTSMSADGTIEVIAERYQGKLLNSPNDLWFDAKGGIYFTDPRYGTSMGPITQDGEHVYYVTSDRKTIMRVVNDMEKPNGVIGSMDGSKLYVANTRGKVFVFDINKDGSLSNKKLFAPQGSDGLALDERGNVYMTWNDDVTIYTAKGTKLESIKFPEKPANVSFGGKQMSTLFVTARKGLYSIEMNVKGHVAKTQ
jgi:gluconolactonase